MSPTHTDHDLTFVMNQIHARLFQNLKNARKSKC